MAVIQARKNKRGTTYQVLIRANDGHPHKYKTFPTKQEAKDWAKLEEARRLKETYFPDQVKKKHTLPELIDRYIEEVLPSKPKNAKDTKRHLEWWKKKIGKYGLSLISYDLIDKYRKEFINKPTEHGKKRNPATVNRYMASLSVVFTYAVKQLGWIKENPMFRFTKLKESKGRKRLLTLEECDRLLKSFKESKNDCLYEFAPLISSKLFLLAEIDITLLWPDLPGQIIGNGDIDNKLKTLLDALSCPPHSNQLKGLAPEESETPFYCLLEDDKLIQNLNVRTHTLLETKDKKELFVLLHVKSKYTKLVWGEHGFVKKQMRMNVKNKNMNDQIALYQQLFNLHVATFSRIDHEDAMVAIVYRVTQPDGKQFILKICDRINDYLREMHFLKLFANKLPVPRIIQVVQPDEHIHGAILMECLPGSLLQLKELSESLAYEIGRCLAGIHLTRLPGYGDPIQDNLSSDPRSYFILKFEEGLDECNNHLPLSLIEKCRRYCDSHLNLLMSVDGPCVVHRDFRPGNLIVHDGKLQGIIDWAGARASFAEEDFCSLEHGEWSNDPNSKKSFL